MPIKGGNVAKTDSAPNLDFAEVIAEESKGQTPAAAASQLPPAK